MTGTTEQKEEKSAQAIWDELEAQDGATPPAPAAEEATRVAFVRALDRRERPVGAAPVPAHLRSAPTALDRSLGPGLDYRYPHEHPDGFLLQNHLPEPLLGAKLYEPRRHGAEKVMDERQRWWHSRAERP